MGHVPVIQSVPVYRLVIVRATVYVPVIVCAVQIHVPAILLRDVQLIHALASHIQEVVAADGYVIFIKV
jgi:hypothetical protein